MGLKREEGGKVQFNFHLARFWHHIKDTPWHAISYLIALIFFVIIYISLKVVLDLYKSLEQSAPVEAFYAALGIIGLFLLVQVGLTTWTWWVLVKTFAQRHIDTSIEEAKALMHVELRHLRDATEGAKNMLPLLKGTSWLRPEVDIGKKEEEWEREIWVVVPDLRYEMNPHDNRFYKSIAKNLNTRSKPRFNGYVYFLPNESTVRNSWVALGERLRGDPDSRNFDYERLKCHFYNAKQSTLEVSMHGLVLFFDLDISKCIAYQYLPPGSDHEFMNVITEGSEPASKIILERCIALLQPYASESTRI